MYLILWETVKLLIPVSAFLCLLLCISNKKYSYFFPFIVCAILIRLIEYKAEQLGNKYLYNAWLYNYESVIEFGTHIWLVSKFIFNRKVKRVVTLFVILYALVGFYRCITIANDYTLDNFVYYTGCGALIIFSCYYFVELLIYPSDLALLKMPSFWFCTAVLLYNSFTFAYFGLNELLTQISKQGLYNLSIAKTLAYLLTYTLFCIAFICQIKIKKFLPSLL